MGIEFINSEIAGLFAYLFSNRDFYSLVENNHDTKFFECMKKLQQEIVKGSISNVHEMNKFIQNALPDRSDKTSEFSKKSIQMMSDYSNFYKQNHEIIEKFYKAVNYVQYDSQKGYVNELNTLYNIFDVSHDVKCYGVLAPVPQKTTDGQAFDNSFIVYYDTAKNDKDKYIDDSLLLERKVSTPLHEATHILFGHSRIKQSLLDENGAGAKHLLAVLDKYFKKHPEAMISNKHTIKTNSIRAIDEAFAASSGAILGKKYGITSEKFYYGFEGANSVAQSLFPVFIEYMNNNKKIDDNFYKSVADTFAKQEHLNSYKTFEEIISSISDKEMMTPYQARSREELNKDNLQLISPEQQRFYLAFYARATYEHVGFEGFAPENQEKFKAQIEQLYANINQDRPQGEFLNELALKTAKYIEDRHFAIGIGNKTFHGGEKVEPRSVGSNFFYNKNKPADYQSLGQGWSEEFGEKFPTWEIGTLKQGEEDILVVSIPNLGGKNDYESWQDFIETFDNVYLPNKEKWDKGRVILDVRGNRGGEDKPIDHIAKRLYGNMLNTYKRCEIKDTALSNYFLHQHGAYKPQNYERQGIKAEDLVVRSNFSGENKTLFDETSTYYPFNEQTGYQGRIDILLDRDVASSAESAYTSFYHHKNIRYIGENTSGMQQYTQGTFPSPWGGRMRVGVTKLTYWDKEGENIEVKGHKPDINCSRQDAFDVALTLGVDEGRTIGFREKNEKVSENQVYAEYNPKSPTDTRKAYYAKYLDPAITEIEENNKILADCMNIVKSNNLGRSILVGANYKEMVGKDVFAEADRKCKEASKKYLNSQSNVEIKDEDLSFAVERIFVGGAGRVDGGHCGFISATKGDKNPQNAHGEIYINENFVRNVVSNLGEQDGCIYLSNVVVHEFLHANQRKHMINEVQDSRSGLLAPRNQQKHAITYDDIQKDKEGFVRNILTEAASMTAGLTVCMQLCEHAGDKSKIIDFALKDVGKIGNVSTQSVEQLGKILNKAPQNKEEQQQLSLDMFKSLVKGEMDFLREKCAKTSLDINLSDYGKLIDTVHHDDLFGAKDELKKTIAEIDMANNVRGVCHDIYHKNIDGLLSKEDASSLENMFMQTTGAYNYFEPQEISNPINQGRNVEKLQNIIRNLCKGKYPANQQIKEFLQEKGHIKENNGQIEFSPSFILQTPDNGLTGGHTKSDKDGNILIVINQQLAERSDNSLAVVMGHEICHQMINDKLQRNGTSAEVEALCDIVGLVAAKGSGYNIRNKIAEDEKDFSQVAGHMEKIINTLYMPKKLKQIAEFIDDKIPITNNNRHKNIVTEKLHSVREKLELRGISSTTKAPYKPQTIEINPDTLRLYQSRKQNN